ncbi:MAG: Mrr restriction system protein [Acetobacteraceae bacterium]|nr:Mrr restriction system protein [Acetobacteraceae bacterium]
MAVTSPHSEVVVPYVRRTGELFQIALRILVESGGQLPLRELLKRIPEKTILTSRDLTVHKNGGERWSISLQFYAINFEKAGFITREQSVWSITPEGEKALALSPEQIITQSYKAYREWKAATLGNKNNDAPEAQNQNHSEIEIIEPNVTASAEIFSNNARDDIARAVLALNPYEFQAFVATVLRGLDYHIARLAPPGPDGGTDILALPDPLGSHQPHVRVQVKHRPNQKVPREDVSKLRGVLKPEREIGLFVASGGFSPDAFREAMSGSPHIRCMDLDQLIDVYLDRYDKLSPKDRERVPLRRIYIYAPDDA